MNEAEVQEQVADYIRLQYPGILFHSDFGSGTKLSWAQARRQKRQNGGKRAWPDMFIAEPRVLWADGYGFGQEVAGLFIELKKEGTKIYTKKGTLVSNEHIREQYDMLEQLHKRGYAAEFACGFDEAKRIIDEYLR